MSIKISAMAYKRKDAVRLIRDRQHVIAEHVAKVVVYKDSLHVNHWCNEMLGFVRNVRSYTNLKGGKLDVSVTFQLLYEEPLGSIDQQQDILRDLAADLKGETAVGTSAELMPAYHGLLSLIYSASALTVDSIKDALNHK